MIAMCRIPTLFLRLLALGGIIAQAPVLGAGVDAAVAAKAEERKAPEKAPLWWSRRPIVRPAVPAGERNPVDAFVRARLAVEGWEPSPEADRTTLARRVYFDLAGLPPTPGQVAEFCQDTSPDAWEKLVDRLLDSPRYGEHWARHWLDVIHFADTHGFEHDVFRPNAWRFRDYVIGSFNSDTPWAQFIEEQLAADVLFPDKTELTPALGFLGAGPFDASAQGTAPRSFENLDRDDLVTQTMSAFTSTTANCARCHAHKFDDIPQADYYALQAVFAGVGKGEISYDATRATAETRRRATSLLTAAKAGDTAVLTDPDNTAKLVAWEAGRQSTGGWHVLNAETFLSANGATLTKQPDGSLLASGIRPDKESLIVTGGTGLSRMTALRLEVLPDPSLPAGGPGRADNGNLHLSGVSIQVFAPGAAQGANTAIASATADWNQDGWPIDKVLDADPATEWGIFPKTGEAHQAVFALAAPVDLPAGTKVAVTLNQFHGGSHLIGRFRLSVTAAAPEYTLALSAAGDAALAKAPADRSPQERTILSAAVLGAMAQRDLASLPPQAKVYAAGRTYDIGNGPLNVGEPHPVHVLQRGDLDQPLVVAKPGALSEIAELNPLFPSDGDEGQRRAALAHWLADPRNPLTWRSIANRVWQWHFGQGLCATPGDLGKMGALPANPELLDWLAAELRDNGGSLKKLHRLILTSGTWRQSSANRETPAQRDPDNHLLWRMNVRRLGAESYCDTVMAAAGRLDLTAGGPGVGHFVTSPGPQSTPVVDYTAFNWNSPGAGRRSIYRVVWRGIPDPLMDALDFPDAAVLTAARGFSASALQALALWNNPFVLFHADALAARGVKENAADPVGWMFREILLREPTAAELKIFNACAGRDGLPEAGRILFNSNEFLFVP